MLEFTEVMRYTHSCSEWSLHVGGGLLLEERTRFGFFDSPADENISEASGMEDTDWSTTHRDSKTWWWRVILAHPQCSMLDSRLS